MINSGISVKFIYYFNHKLIPDIIKIKHENPIKFC